VLAPPALALTTPAGVQPTGAAYDLVLIGHVLCALAGLVTTAVSAVQATRLAGALAPSAAAPVPAGLRNYYVPGPHLAGRLLYGVPVFGGALLALSHGIFGLQDAWVESGIVLWIAAIVVCEAAVWPGENELGAHVGPAAPPPDPGPAALGPDPARAARRVAGSAWTVVALLVVATGCMVLQP
jgi:hypothetical protein